MMENLAKKIDEKLDEKLVAAAAGRQSLSSDTLNAIQLSSVSFIQH